MGYIEGLLNTSFKKTEGSRSIFFPYGIFGSGYYISQDEESKLKRFVEIYYKITFLSFIFVLVFFGLNALWLLLLDLPWYHIKVKRILKGAERAQERTTFSEQIERMAAANGMLTNVILLGMSLLMVGGAIFCIFLPDKEAKVAGALGVAFFGACLWQSVVLVKYSARSAIGKREIGTGFPGDRLLRRQG